MQCACGAYRIKGEKSERLVPSDEKGYHDSHAYYACFGGVSDAELFPQSPRFFDWREPREREKDDEATL